MVYVLLRLIIAYSRKHMLASKMNVYFLPVRTRRVLTVNRTLAGCERAGVVCMSTSNQATNILVSPCSPPDAPMTSSMTPPPSVGVIHSYTWCLGCGAWLVRFQTALPGSTAGVQSPLYTAICVLLYHYYCCTTVVQVPAFLGEIQAIGHTAVFLPSA